jgi:hypothetical protein
MFTRHTLQKDHNKDRSSASQAAEEHQHKRERENQRDPKKHLFFLRDSDK